jgi:hypothetical protein
MIGYIAKRICRLYRQANLKRKSTAAPTGVTDMNIIFEPDYETEVKTPSPVPLRSTEVADPNNRIG